MTRSSYLVPCSSLNASTQRTENHGSFTSTYYSSPGSSLLASAGLVPALGTVSGLFFQWDGEVGGVVVSQADQVLGVGDKILAEESGRAELGPLLDVHQLVGQQALAGGVAAAHQHRVAEGHGVRPRGENGHLDEPYLSGQRLGHMVEAGKLIGGEAAAHSPRSMAGSARNVGAPCTDQEEE